MDTSLWSYELLDGSDETLDPISCSGEEENAQKKNNNKTSTTF